VRARLAVISEMPGELARLLPEWIERTNSLRTRAGDRASPSAGDIAMLLQMIVGAWPLDLAIDDDQGRAAFAERLAGWQEKALREAKLVTDWTSPNESYESAAHALLMGLVAERRTPALLDDIVHFINRISPAGAVNGLAQVLLKLTSPGVPDLYQGTEYWDFSLVDPDNRRPVDFAARAASVITQDIQRLLAEWRDGRIKQAIVTQALSLRRQLPRLFSEGSYEPIEIEGSHADRIVAFARRHHSDIAITIVPRLAHDMLVHGAGITFDASAWKDTALKFDNALPRSWRSVFDGQSIDLTSGKLAVADLLNRCPVTLLIPSSQ